MNKIKWCLKKGFEITEPNENLTIAYIKKAEDSLRAASVLEDNKDWEISALYYTAYFSLYAILMKIGIKSEIHSCTIEFMKEYLKEYFTKGDMKYIQIAQKARIDTQYYSDRNITKDTQKLIIDNTPLFLAKCKEVNNKLKEADVNKIREKIIK